MDVALLNLLHIQRATTLPGRSKVQNPPKVYAVAAKCAQEFIAIVDPDLRYSGIQRSEFVNQMGAQLTVVLCVFHLKNN